MKNKYTSVGGFAKKVAKDADPSKSYGTSLMQEHIIVSAYKQMRLSQLEDMRKLINKIIKEKKEYRRAQEARK